MKQKRSIIIDREFQLKKTFAVVGGATAIIALIIVAVGIMITVNNRKVESNNLAIKGNIQAMWDIIDLQQEFMLQFSLMPTGSGKRDYASTALKLSADYNSSMEKLNTAVSDNESMMRANHEIADRNFQLMLAVALVTVAGLCALFYALIKFTHRISGPIFLMTRHTREILAGEEPDMRDLRDKDDFKEFYDLYRQLAEGYIRMAKKK